MKSHSIFALAIIALLICTAAEAEYSGGTGMPNDPYQIADANDLLALGANTADYDKCFILTADVDLQGQVFTTAIIAPDTDNSDYTYTGTVFTGTFDGNGHVISNFTINGSDQDCVGLFGCVVSPGQVKNLGVERGNITGRYNAGALVGMNGGGWNGGVIMSCYATVVVSSPCYVGGLVGYNDGEISNCYSTGSVSGDGDVGGLVGLNDGGISDCYSMGAVSGNYNVGGLLGRNYGTLTFCFWDTETSGQSGSVGGTGKTTVEMKTLSTFTLAGWDFIEIWGIGENQTYPYLRTEPAGDLNHDKKVDFGDLAIFASHWLEGTGPY